MNRTTERVRRLATALRQARDVPSTNAALPTGLFMEAEPRGLISHGLQRLPFRLSCLGKGFANAKANGEAWRMRSFLSVEGERGLGRVVAVHAPPQPLLKHLPALEAA